MAALLMVGAAATGCASGQIGPSEADVRAVWDGCGPSAATPVDMQPFGSRSVLTAGERRAGRSVASLVARALPAEVFRAERARRGRAPDPAARRVIERQIGVGVAVDRYTLLTAHHVARWARGVELGGRYFTVRTSRVDEQHDVATLRTARPMPVEGTIDLASGPARHERLVVWSRDLPTRRGGGPVAAPVRLAARTTVPWVDITSPEKPRSMEALPACGGGLVRGRSGSPVVDAQGRLVGLAVARGGRAADVAGTLVAPVTTRTW